MAAKPVTLTAGANPNPHLAPEPLIVVGGLPGIDPQAAPAVDDSPADAAAVAADLQGLVDALVAAGVLTV